MAKGGGGGGNPLMFTGGGPMTPPAPQAGVSVPSYPNFLPSSGDIMATPESVSTAYNTYAAQPPPPPQPAAPAIDYNALRQMLAKMMQQPRQLNPQNYQPGGAMSPYSASSNSGGGYQGAGSVMSRNLNRSGINRGGSR